MSQYVETATKTFTAGGAIGPYLRVKLSGLKLAVAGIADGPGVELGTIEEEAFADGDVRAVRLRTAQGTRKVVAAGAIAVGAAVYTAANGKVNDVADSTSYLRGIALEEATADGDIIEIVDDWPMAAESG